MSTPAPNEALALRDLAMAQQAKLDAIDGDFNSNKKATVIALESEGTPAVTINLSGNEDVDIPGVHYLDSYAPVIGDTVLVGRQGAELLVIGKVASQFADGTWTQATLSSGWSHDAVGSGGSGPVYYRRVIDHGDYKIQWKGGANRSSGGQALCEVLPEGFRPTSRRIFVQPRNTFYGNDVKLQFETSGIVTVEGMVVNIAGTTNLQNIGNTIVSNLQSDGSSNHNGSNHTHQVTGINHTHGISIDPEDPAWVLFDGVEYFV